MKGYYCFGGGAEKVQAAMGLPADGDKVFSVVRGGEKVFFPEDNFVRESEGGAAACCGYVLNGASWTASKGINTRS